MTPFFQFMISGLKSGRRCPFAIAISYKTLPGNGIGIKNVTYGAPASMSFRASSIDWCISASVSSGKPIIMFTGQTIPVFVAARVSATTSIFARLSLPLA